MPQKGVLPFIVFNIGLIIYTFTILLPLVQQSMFVDGVTYSAISNNLANSFANGTGKWFHLSYSPGLYADFYMHPPFVFWLQSLFFRFLGDYWWTERIFVFCNSMALLVTIAYLYDTICDVFSIKTTAFAKMINLVFWLCVPVVFWATAANLLETTMCIFTNLAAISALKWLHKRSFVAFFLAVFATIVAFLCKGPTSLFVWAIPFLYLFMVENKEPIFSKLVKSALLPLVSTLIFAGLLYAFPPAMQFFQAYFKQQILSGVLHESTTGSRFYIIYQSFLEFSIPILLSVVGSFFAFRNDFAQARAAYTQPAMRFCIAVALCAILPIMLTLKQRGYYVFCAMPFLSLAFALPFALAFAEKISEVSTQILKKTAIALSVLSIVSLAFCSTQTGKIARKSDAISDLLRIKALIKPNQRVLAPFELYQDWALQAYLARFGNIGLGFYEHENTTNYCITKRDTPPSPGYTKLVTPENEWIVLYAK